MTLLRLTTIFLAFLLCNVFFIIQVTTINGAKIVEDKQDIVIPQGIAHAVDRVMFPLPVGDIVQTLQSDRERRFTTFLRILFASGLAESLQGMLFMHIAYHVVVSVIRIYCNIDKYVENFSY